MKSCKVCLEQLAEPANLREAFLRSARGKVHKTDVIAFRANLDAELALLRQEILTGTVTVGRFTAFTIWEPKERRIHAPCFRERVLHHALIGPCEADFERWLAVGRLTEAAAQRSVVAMAAFARVARRETILRTLFSGTGHRAPTASTAAAAGGTTPSIATRPIATGMSRTTAGTTSASASLSAHATRPSQPPD